MRCWPGGGTRRRRGWGLAVGADLDWAVGRADPLLEAPGWDEITPALIDPEMGLCSRSARFIKADVVEHICALSGGRLSVEEILALADRFVAPSWWSG